MQKHCTALFFMLEYRLISMNEREESRRMNITIKKAITIVAITLILITGCGTSQTVQRDKHLNLALPSDLSDLNNITVSNANSAQLLGNVIEGLTTYDKEGELIGAVAESWDVSSDELVYTFKLRDAYWQDGTAITASDFVFGWQKIVTVPGATYNRYVSSILNGKEIKAGEKDISDLGVRAKSEKEFEITLVQQLPFILDLAAFPSFGPLKETFYTEVGEENYGTSVDTILTNGAYNLTDFSADGGYKLQKSETYWDKKNVDLETITARVVKQSDTRATLYEAGEIDQLILTSDLLDKYSGDKDLVTEYQGRMSHIYLSDTIDPTSPLVNRNFRAAIAHAIDKELLTENVLKDGSLPADYLIPRHYFKVDGVDFRDYSGLYNDLAYDPSIAADYLEQAKLELGDIPLSFKLTVSDAETSKKVYEFVKEQLETNLEGVSVELETLPNNTFTPKLREKTTIAGGTGWLSGMKDPSVFLENYRSGYQNNYGNYFEAEYDELLTKIESPELAVDRTKRGDAIVAAEDTLLNDYQLIPLSQQGIISLVKPHIKGLKNLPTIPTTIYKYIYTE